MGIHTACSSGRTFAGMPTAGQHASIPPDTWGGRHHSSGGGMHACHNCAFLRTCADIAGSRSRGPPFAATHMRRTLPARHTCLLLYMPVVQASRRAPTYGPYSFAPAAIPQEQSDSLLLSCRLPSRRRHGIALCNGASHTAGHDRRLPRRWA